MVGVKSVSLWEQCDDMSGVAIMRMSKTVILGLVAGAVGVVAPAIAQTPVGPSAQGYFDRDRNTPVTQRQDAALSPGGIPAGSFRLYPTLSTQFGYSDNVFASNVNEQSSSVARGNASLNFVSNWGRHALEFFGALGGTTYFDADSANTYTATFGANARIDASRDTTLDGGASYFQGKEELTENPAAGLIEPVEYRELLADIGIQQTFNRIRLGASLSTSDYEYNDSTLFNGRPQDQDFRDHSSVALQIRSDIALTYDTSLFAQFTTSTIEYDAPGFLAPSRDADDYEYLAGADFDLTNLTRGQVGIGWFSREFDSPLVSNVDGFAVNAGVDWFVTPLISTAFNARRGMTESALLTAPSAVETSVAAGVDYAFRRNVTLSGGVSYSNFDYKGLDRSDDNWMIQTGASYLVNRWSAVTFDLSYTTRASSGTAMGTDYDRIMGLIGIRLYR